MSGANKIHEFSIAMKLKRQPVNHEKASQQFKKNEKRH